MEEEQARVPVWDRSAPSMSAPALGRRASSCPAARAKDEAGMGFAASHEHIHWNSDKRRDNKSAQK